MDLGWLTRDVALYALLPSMVVVAGTTSVLWWRRERGALPIGGAALCAVVAFALSAGTDRPSSLWIGALVAGGGSAVAGTISRWLPKPLDLGLHMVAIAPGAVIAVRELTTEAAPWMEIAGVAAACVTGAAVDRLDRQHHTSSGPFLMLLGSVAAVWLTVPETDVYTFVMVAAVPLILLAWPWQFVNLGPGGGAATMTFVAALIIESGLARDGAVIGGLGVAGVLIVGLFGTRLAPLEQPTWTPAAYQIVAIQAVTTFLIVRVAGLRSSAVPALVILAIIYAVMWTILQRWTNTGAETAAPVG